MDFPSYFQLALHYIKHDILNGFGMLSGRKKITCPCELGCQNIWGTVSPSSWFVNSVQIPSYERP